MHSSRRPTFFTSLGTGLGAAILTLMWAGPGAAEDGRARREVLLGVSGGSDTGGETQRSRTGVEPGRRLERAPSDRDRTGPAPTEPDDDNAARLQIDMAREQMARGDATRARALLLPLTEQLLPRDLREEVREMLLALPAERGEGLTASPLPGPMPRSLPRLPETPETEQPQRGEQSTTDARSAALPGPAAESDTAPMIGPPAPLRGNERLDARAQARLESLFRAQVGDRVFFARGSAELDRRAHPVLRAQADWLRANPLLSVTIEGHSDDGGSSQAEHAIAQRRAEAVREVLTTSGVAPDRVTVVVFGRDRRVAPCEVRGCAPHNRRVVTSVGGAPEEVAGAAARDLSARRER